MLDTWNKDSPTFELDKGICKCIDVYDGDTCTVLILYPGMTLPVRHNVRLYGIDTPELRAPKDMENRDYHVYRARLARDTLFDLIGNKVISFTIRGKDKYNRLLASLTLEDGRDVVKVLLEKGLGVEYYGEGKNKVAVTPRASQNG